MKWIRKWPCACCGQYPVYDSQSDEVSCGCGTVSQMFRPGDLTWAFVRYVGVRINAKAPNTVEWLSQPTPYCDLHHLNLEPSMIAKKQCVAKNCQHLSFTRIIVRWEDP